MGGCRTYTRSCNCWQGPQFFSSHNPAQTRHLSGPSWAIHSTGGSAADTWSDRDGHHCLSLFLFKQSLCCNILVLLYFTLATGLVAVLSSTCMLTGDVCLGMNWKIRFVKTRIFQTSLTPKRNIVCYKMKGFCYLMVVTWPQCLVPSLCSVFTVFIKSSLSFSWSMSSLICTKCQQSEDLCVLCLFWWPDVSVEARNSSVQLTHDSLLHFGWFA